jgi:hypothetical protein
MCGDRDGDHLAHPVSALDAMSTVPFVPRVRKNVMILLRMPKNFTVTIQFFLQQLPLAIFYVCA